MTEIINNPMEILSLAVFTFGLAAMFFSYGRQVLKERWKEMNYAEETITTDMVYRYFKEQGCKVWHVSPERNTTNWSAFLVKDGRCYVVKVYTDSKNILGHEHSLA